MIRRLDGLLIGGGFIIRFDKEVAPGYAPPSPQIHHPTGYWLTPALIALQNNVPGVWNAPGTDGKSVPDWASPLMHQVLTLSRYVSVRDEPSRTALERLASAPISVVLDTAFGLPRLLALRGTPSPDVTRLSKAHGLDGPYIIVQATSGVEGFIRFIKNHVEQLRNLRFLRDPTHRWSFIGHRPIRELLALGLSRGQQHTSVQAQRDGDLLPPRLGEYNVAARR